MKIVELDSFGVNPGDMSWEPLKQLGDLTLYDRTSEEDVVERAKDADMILVNKVNITREIIEQLPNLKYIGELATGYNNIDCAAAREHGIVVSNIPAYSTDSVAQHVFALLLNVTNHVDDFARQNRDLRWAHHPDFCYWDEPLHELCGKSFGIIGFGNIGSKVASIAHAMGMKVLAATSKAPEQLPEYVEKVDINSLYALSDVLSLHCPLVKEGPHANVHMINAETLSKMRPTAILINTGRGPLVDEAAMAEALQQKKIAAYCADVMAQEPPKADNPLFAQPHAFLTPHVAWATVEARQRLMEICIENVKAFLNGSPINVVN